MGVSTRSLMHPHVSDERNKTPICGLMNYRFYFTSWVRATVTLLYFRRIALRLIGEGLFLTVFLFYSSSEILKKT